MEEFLKTQNLTDMSSYYVNFFIKFDKIGKTTVKKSWRERKKQYHLQQAQNLEIRTIKINTVFNGGVCKNLSYIIYFKCENKGYYTNKYSKLREDRNVINNWKLSINDS